MNSAPRKLMSQLSFAIGSVWAVAGGGRLVFGERITLPILPALDLHQVHAVSALAVGLGCFAVAAVLGRGLRARPAAAEDPLDNRLVGMTPASSIDGLAYGPPLLRSVQPARVLQRTPQASHSSGTPSSIPASQRR